MMRYTPTPIPWVVTPAGGIAGEGEDVIVNDMATLANYGGRPFNEGFGRASANAAFIVTACNAHNELVDALAKLVKAIELEAPQTPKGSPMYRAGIGHAMSNCRAVLAKIKGER